MGEQRCRPGRGVSDFEHLLIRSQQEQGRKAVRRRASRDLVTLGSTCQRQKRRAVLAPAMVAESRSSCGGRISEELGEFGLGKCPWLAADVEHGLALDDTGVRGQPLVVGRVGRAHTVSADALDLDVVAVAAVEDIRAQPAEEHVVAGAAEEDVVAVAADQHIVALAAVGGEQDHAGREAGSVDDVVAGQGVDGQPVVGGFGPGDVDLGGEADDGHAAGVARPPGPRRRRWCPGR